LFNKLGNYSVIIILSILHISFQFKVVVQSIQLTTTYKFIKSNEKTSNLLNN